MKEPARYINTHSIDCLEVNLKHYIKRTQLSKNNSAIKTAWKTYSSENVDCNTKNKSPKTPRITTPGSIMRDLKKWRVNLNECEKFMREQLHKSHQLKKNDIGEDTFISG